MLKYFFTACLYGGIKKLFYNDKYKNQMIERPILHSHVSVCMYDIMHLEMQLRNIPLAELSKYMKQI